MKKREKKQGVHVRGEREQRDPQLDWCSQEGDRQKRGRVQKGRKKESRKNNKRQKEKKKERRS